MTLTTTIIVLAVWAGIGSLFYEQPPCEAYVQTTYIDDQGWEHHETECIKQPVFW